MSLFAFWVVELLPIILHLKVKICLVMFDEFIFRNITHRFCRCWKSPKLSAISWSTCQWCQHGCDLWCFSWVAVLVLQPRRGLNPIKQEVSWEHKVLFRIRLGTEDGVHKEWDPHPIGISNMICREGTTTCKVEIGCSRSCRICRVVLEIDYTFDCEEARERRCNCFWCVKDTSAYLSLFLNINTWESLPSFSITYVGWNQTF